MTPSVLIEKLDSLLPEIKKTRDPEGVLLKCATEENMSPAQLERMAQLYNTAKTLTHMNKSADRGANFSIIDTPSLLSRFTETPETREVIRKAASSAQPDENNISAWVDAPVESSSDFRFPDVELLEMQQALETVRKQASAELAVPSAREIRKAQCISMRELETLLQVRDDHWDRGHDMIDKLAQRIFEEGIPFSEAEQDILEITGEHGVVEKLAAKLDARKIPYTRTKQASRKLTVDRYGLVAIAREAADAFGIAETSDAMYKEASVQDAPPAEEADLFKDVIQPKRQEREDAARAAEEKRLAGEHAPKEKKDKGEPATPRVSASKPERSEKTGKPDGGRSGGSPLLDSVGAWGQQGAGDWINPAFGTKSTQSILDLIGPGSNARQEKRDNAYDETQAAVVLQRLLLSDPVISEADPNTVTSLANSIRRANPEASRDINVMKSLLREAIQYDALPAHAYKDLISTRESTAKAKGYEEKNRGDRYGIK